MPTDHVVLRFIFKKTHSVVTTKRESCRWKRTSLLELQIWKSSPSGHPQKTNPARGCSRKTLLWKWPNLLVKWRQYPRSRHMSFYCQWKNVCNIDSEFTPFKLILAMKHSWYWSQGTRTSSVNKWLTDWFTKDLDPQWCCRSQHLASGQPLSKLFWRMKLQEFNRMAIKWNNLNSCSQWKSRVAYLLSHKSWYGY